MMRLKLLKPVVISGHPGLAVGDIFESDDRGLLFYCEEVKPEARVERAADIETREPVVENRDPQPKRLKKTLP